MEFSRFETGAMDQRGSPLPAPFRAQALAELQSLIEKAERYRDEHLATGRLSSQNGDRASEVVLDVIEGHLKFLHVSLAFMMHGELPRKPEPQPSA
jgi:hypothetical protein